MQNLSKAVRLMGAAVILGWTVCAHATGLFSFGDTEKPKPEFQLGGRQITAKLIPRAKSTSVTIAFEVKSGGRLVEVKGVDFETVDRPEVDVKNFKSAVFEIRITDVKPGETVAVSLQSDFFTQSTAFYAFNPTRDKPWVKDVQSENIALSGRVRELVVAARDGGDIDADGSANGQVTVIGGPRDSFWGYALGTLFIRFFGIFIVLCILMLGMILSGFVFRSIERRKSRRVEDQKTPARPPAEKQSAGAAPDDAEAGAPAVKVPGEVAAAIGVAMHLHFSSLRRPAEAMEAAPQEGAWAAEGRVRMMSARLSVFNRQHR